MVLFEFERHVSAVRENARDAAVVFVTHYDRRQSLADIESAIIESPNLPKLSSRVIYPNQRAIRSQESIELFVNLSIGKWLWCAGNRRWSRCWCRKLKRARVRAKALLGLLISNSFRGWIQIYWHNCVLSGHHNSSTHFCLLSF